MLWSEPTSKIACFVFLKLVALGIWIQEHIIGNFRIELAKSRRDHRAKRRARETRTVRVPARKQIDSLQMLRLLGMHAADDVELGCDARTTRHEGRKVNARNVRRNAAERTAARPAWL